MEPSTDGEESSVKDATPGGSDIGLGLASLGWRHQRSEVEEGSFGYAGMDVEGSASQKSENGLSQQSSDSSTPPELKRSRHDPVFGYDNSYGNALDSTSVIGLSRPSKKRERSHDSLTSSFDKVVMVSSPRTGGGGTNNDNYKRFRKGAGYGESPSPTTTTTASSTGIGETPDTTTKGSDHESKESADDIDYSKVNAVLRSLRLGREGRKSQPLLSRSPPGSVKMMSISTLKANPQFGPDSSPRAPATAGPAPSSAPVSLLAYQQRYIRDYQRRQRNERDGSQGSSDMEL